VLKSTKSAVHRTSLPHFICIQKSFRVTNFIIYAKDTRTHINDKSYLKSAMQQYQGPCELQIANCALGKKIVSNWIQVVSAYEALQQAR